jgi:hypothetical protein
MAERVLSHCYLILRSFPAKQSDVGHVQILAVKAMFRSGQHDEQQ